MLVDFEHSRLVFPPEIFSTPLRPDIVIWSNSSKQVYLVELTCPAEEGIENAALRKEARYASLIDSINSQQVWKAQLFTIEVGARGFVAHSTRRWLFRLGLGNQKISRLCKGLSEVVARCSYSIYLARSDVSWDRTKLLPSPSTSLSHTLPTLHLPLHVHHPFPHLLWHHPFPDFYPIMPSLSSFGK